MKKTLIASFSALLILVSSCKTKTGDQKANIIQSLDHVAIVANVNVRAIMEKGKFLENIPELGMAMAFSPIKINDSTNTGFDPISNKIIVVNTNQESGEGDVIMLFDILHKTKFRATLDKQIPMKLEEREKDGFTILKFSESGNGAALVYNDKMGF